MQAVIMKSFLLLSLAATAISSGLATKPLPPDPSPVCKLPKAVGTCRAKISRFYYDFSSKSCRKFIYSGCSGNENNFKRRADCKSTCKGPKPVPPIDPPTDICKLPIVVGPCKAAFLSWGFENGKCKQFAYGGCQGNENRFGTKEECEKTCGKPRHPTPSQDICELPIVVGPCEALIASWGFEKGACKEFTYGGCEGNENRFSTKDACKAACGGPADPPPPPDICKLPIVVGPCKAAFPSWGFENGECKQFTYGGCQGNENRFSTKEDCEKACDKPSPPAEEDGCSLPLDGGLCLAAFKRFGFKDGKCVEFVYGGCGANGNNFETVEECEKECGKKY
jgi:papilin